MLDPTSPAASVYNSQTWALAAYAAANVNQYTGNRYSATDFTAAAAANRDSLGVTWDRQTLPGLSQLYGVAVGIEKAADQLTAAPDESPILDTHVSEPPWSRPQPAQDAAPMWQARAEVSYRAPDGSVVTTWGTGVFHSVLPTSVGAMRQELTLQLQRLLSQRDEQHNTGGELLGIGRTYLMAV